MAPAEDFEDIIALPHHVSSTRPRMKQIDRAAQFSPFAALTGYDAAIRETGRLTERRIELSEDSKIALDRKLAQLRLHLHEQPEVIITHFVPDTRKEGGRYVTHTGQLKRIDDHRRLILLCSGTVIPLDDVLELDSPLLCRSDYHGIYPEDITTHP